MHSQTPGSLHITHLCLGKPREICLPYEWRPSRCSPAAPPPALAHEIARYNPCGQTTCSVMAACGTEVARCPRHVWGAPTRGASNVKAVTGTSGPKGWSLWRLMPDCTCTRPAPRAQSSSLTSAVICKACYIQDACLRLPAASWQFPCKTVGSFTPSVNLSPP